MKIDENSASYNISKFITMILMVFLLIFFPQYSLHLVSKFIGNILLMLGYYSEGYAENLSIALLGSIILLCNFILIKHFLTKKHNKL